MTIFHFNPVKNAVCAGLACGFAILTAWPSDARAQEIELPSGQLLSFLEFIEENDGDLVRFRFFAPQIGVTMTFMDVVGDFQVLCDELVMPALDRNGFEPNQIVLSMSAEDIPFGEDNPDVLQFFEVFRPENGLCIWEEF